MSDIAISIESLSKAYLIGLKEEVHETLTGALLSWSRAPLRNLRRLQRLNTFGRAVATQTSEVAGRVSNVSEVGHDANGSAVEDPDILWALRDVSFDVKRGEVVGIIGRNGAGKSTLLKILSRITDPTSGRAVIRGRVSSLLEVGTGFHPELTGRENVYMNGTILGMRKKEIDRKFDEIAAFSGVEKLLDTPVKRYSSGMKVRLAFAVAAHLEPEILIIDEVLAVGDFEFQAKCLGKMNEVANSGRTVLFVSHNMAAVEALCTRGVLLQRGQLEMTDAIGEVISKYTSSATSGLPNEYDRRTVPSGGNSGGVVQRFRIVDRNGVSTSQVNLGDDLHFELVMAPPRPLNYVRIAIRIFNDLSQRITTCHNDYQHREILRIADRATVRCTLEDCRLIPGIYHIDVEVDERRERLEKLESVMTFEILSSDIYGTGRQLPRHAGIVVPRVRWQYP